MRKPFLTTGLFGLLTNLPDQQQLLATADTATRREVARQLRDALAAAASSRDEDEPTLTTLLQVTETARTRLPAGSAASHRLGRLREQAAARAQHDSPTRALQFLAAELVERCADLAFEPVAECPGDATAAAYAGIDEIELIRTQAATGDGTALATSVLSIGARGPESAVRVQELRLRLERWLQRPGSGLGAIGPARVVVHNSPAVGPDRRWFQVQFEVRQLAG